MKTILIFLSTITMFISCTQPAGTTSTSLTGVEKGLPEELKGMRIYTVWDDDNSYVKVAILDGKVVSTTYPLGKTIESLILIDKSSDSDNRIIEVSQIISENDSLIVVKKRKN